MAWSVDWEVEHSIHGARPGDDSNRVDQHDRARFTLRLHGTDEHARQFVLDPANWSEVPTMLVTGFDGDGNEIRTNTVAASRDYPLAFDYQFEYAGRKRIDFRGRINTERAHSDMYGETGMAEEARATRDTGAEASTMGTTYRPDTRRLDAEVANNYPPIALSMSFEVTEELTAGGASATTMPDSRSARRRRRVAEDDSEVAASDREAAAAAEAQDLDDRVMRGVAARAGVTRRGIVRMPAPWNRLLTDEEIDELDEAAMDEYSRDLRAVLSRRVTPPLLLDGNTFSARSHEYRGHWSWEHVSESEIEFFFLATQISVEGGGTRACDDAEAAIARSSSGVTYGTDEWILARVPGESRSALVNVFAFARDVTWSRIMSVLEAVDEVMTALDIVEIVTGFGSIVVGIRRVARWLLTHSGRILRGTIRHADDIGRAASHVLAHSDDIARTSGDVARGIGGATTSATDDVARGLGSAARGTADDAARGLAAGPPLLADDAARAMGSRAGGGAASSAARTTSDEARGLASGVPDLAGDATRAGALDEVDDAFAAMSSGARSGTSALPTPPIPYTPTAAARTIFENARTAFARLQRGYARALGLAARSGAQVHHAIELNVIVRYGPDVFSVAELNALRNMRGIVPERTLLDEMSSRYGLRQLHNSAIRRRWDDFYGRIDRIIADESLIAGTPAYRTRVRGLLEMGRDAIDDEFHMFFSGSGAGLAAGLGRGGRSALDWGRSGMLPRDLESLGDAAATGTVLSPPPALRR